MNAKEARELTEKNLPQRLADEEHHAQVIVAEIKKEIERQAGRGYFYCSNPFDDIPPRVKQIIEGEGFKLDNGFINW